MADAPFGFECSACRINYYHVNDVRMFYSACDHRICERCFGRLFRIGRMYPCPACGQNLRAEDFSEHSQDEQQANAELKIRRQVCDVFCRTSEDFETLSEFNNYLERREDLVYRLVNPISQEDEKEAWREISAHKEANAEHILRAQQLKPKRRVAKILNVISEEGGFANAVNSDWGKQQPPGAESHEFLERYKSILSGGASGAAGKTGGLTRGLANLGTSGIIGGHAGSAAQDGSSSPLVPQPLHGEYGPADVTRQMRGGGQDPDTCRRKARHFFFADLAAATAAFASHA